MPTTTDWTEEHISKWSEPRDSSAWTNDLCRLGKEQLKLLDAALQKYSDRHYYANEDNGWHWLLQARYAVMELLA